MTEPLAYLLGLAALAAGSVLFLWAAFGEEWNDDAQYHDLTDLVKGGTDATRVARVRTLLDRGGNPPAAGGEDRGGGVVR